MAEEEEVEDDATQTGTNVLKKFTIFEIKFINFLV